MSITTITKIDNCLIRIRGVFPYHSKTHKRIAEQFLNHAGEIVHRSITELAEYLNVSEGSIVLVCKKLGYEGYHDLKLNLSLALSDPSDIHEEISVKDSMEQIIKKVFNSSMQTLADTINVLNARVMEETAAAMYAAGKIIIIGTGISGIVAKDLWIRLMRLGKNIVYYDDPTMIKMAASIMERNTFLFSVSHSGSTLSVVGAIEAAKKKGLRTAILTNFLNSPASKLCDYVLLTSSRETGTREEEMTSRIAQLAVIDSLFVAIAHLDYERAVKLLDDTRRAVADDKM